MVDTHAHLGLCEPADRELVDAAQRAGVERILTVGIDEESNRTAIGAAVAHSGVHAAVGRHPNSAAGFDGDAAQAIEQLAAAPEVRAIGETGLDFYRDRAPREDQRRAFASQIKIARRTGLPLVIHLRDSQGAERVKPAATRAETSADDAGPSANGGAVPESAVDEAFGTLAHQADGVTVILHCYSAGPARVEEAAQRGWYCSFAGNVTYPKAVELHEAARLVPLELLLVETDAPFLSPQTVRGKPNQPANVVSTAERLAELRGLSYGEIEAAIDTNAAMVFGW